MTYIITILLVVGICMIICAIVAEKDSVSHFCRGVFVACFITAVVLILCNTIFVSAEDYINNPAAYQLDNNRHSY